MIRLCWHTVDEDWFDAYVDEESLQFLYELLTISGGVSDTVEHIFCVFNYRKYEVQAMMRFLNEQ